MEQNLYKTDSRFQKSYEEFGKLQASIGKSKSWNSMGYICLKTTFFHLKHYLQIYLTLLVVWKMTWRIWQIFSRALHRGVICHDNEELRKNWRGIYLSFQSWHEESDKFWPEHLKISQILILMGSFWAKYILFEPKK